MKNQKSNLSRQLSLQDIADMMAHFVWVPELYRTYETSLQSEYFRIDPDQDESGFSCVFRALQKYYAKEGTKQKPDRARLEIYTRTNIRECPVAPDIEEMIFADDPAVGIIANLYDTDRVSLTYTTGEPLVKQFLVERAIANAVIKHVNDMNEFNGYVDMSETEHLKRMAAEAERIEGISAVVEIEDLAPDLSYFNKMNTYQGVPSGIPWIDAHIERGQRYGDVNGIIGPTGAGKTTLGSQLFVSNVREAIKQYASGQDDRLCVFYTYEQRSFDLQQKVFSNAFSIARSSIREDQRLLDTFSNGTTIPLKPYEIGRFNNKSEVERYNMDREYFSRHGIIRNMSGVADICDDERMINIKKNKGIGGLSELVSDLHYIQDTRKQGIRAVFIDYIGLVMERQFSVTEESDVFYRGMKRFPDEVRQKVAGEFNCVVWLLHQMSGAANKVKPTTPLHHADAEGCRSLANNMSNCLCLGNPDTGSEGGGKCLYLSFSKLRNSGASGFDSVNLILQHNAVFARLDDVTSQYKPDKSSGCFYPVNEDVFSE